MKPLSAKEFEVGIILLIVGILLIFGVSGSRDLSNFAALPETRIAEWAEYLPGVWEAVDADGNVHRMSFPDCDVAAISGSHRQQRLYGPFGSPNGQVIAANPIIRIVDGQIIQTPPVELIRDRIAASNQQRANQQSGNPSIGTSSGPFSQGVVVIQRNSSLVARAKSRQSSWSIDRAGEQYALVSTPRTDTSNWLNQSRDEIYLEVIDRNQIRATNQRRVRAGHTDVLVYERILMPSDYVQPAGYSGCIPQY